MMNNYEHTRGYMVLTTVLIMSAILIVISVGMAVRGSNASQIDIQTHASRQAKFFTDTCIEIALLKLQQDVSYTGNETIPIATETCEIETITGTGATNREIDAWSSVNGAIYRAQVLIADLGPPIRITSWERVDAF